MGNKLQFGLMFFYVFLAGVFLFEGNWHKSLYWIGAFIITLSVWLMR